MTILDDIINWVENKPKFWQVAIDLLIRNGEVTASDIQTLKNICEAEEGLAKTIFTPVDFNSLKAFANHATNAQDIVISKIHLVENIRAISPTSVLEFAPIGLTAVYGDNGAGKSSFVSILKHTCNTRGSKPSISENVYDAASRGADKKAQVEYTHDGTNYHTVSLINESIDSSVLKGVDVFDSSSANHYIDGEDEIAFIPQGLSLVEKLAIVLKQIETEISAELHVATQGRFDFSVMQIEDGTPSKVFLNSISHNTTIDQLKQNCDWKPEKCDRIKTLDAAILALKAADPQREISTNLQKVNRFKILRDKFQALETVLITPEAQQVVETTCNEFVSTHETLDATSKTVFANLPLNGIGGNSWKQLWESARKFYDDNNHEHTFPDTSEASNCPLCLQELGSDAKQRFLNFEEFVKHDTQQQHDAASKNHQDLLDKVIALYFTFEEQEPTILELETLSKDYRSAQDLYIQNLLQQRTYLLKILNEKRQVEAVNTPELKVNAKEIIDSVISNLQAENKKLETQSITDELTPLETELKELVNQKKLYNFKRKLVREIYRQQKVNLLNKCIANCNTRTVTTLSNGLASSYVTQSLKDKFQDELIGLGFTNIKIETETKGVRGKQYHYLKLNEPNAPNVPLKDILSEGEHRCIALSTFLSELSLSDHKSAIVFDDPVSSLDHKWRNKIAKRIVEESKQRQVIVFTHDITFLLMLQEHADELAAAIDIKSLTRKKIETGIISTNLPWDALRVTKRLGILKARQQILAKIERDETDEVYKEKAKPMYGMLRETWERFVEEVLLNGVVQRFGREIQTQRLSKVIDLTGEDFKKVDANMSKCSTYFFGHDSAGALIETMPNAAEMLADISELENFTREIVKRR